ncbi:hypothetical protein CXB51_025243 [Gossypium anomalum]|uniref:Integrase catalytic domain-containing protein n=1 Tax=Gossypium anomalum TaxID=47600 RepID=A0A8J6CRH9_9ROSI|nr:hypothetical protein CXB51_025243 [Gossypium anomalum]
METVMAFDLSGTQSFYTASNSSATAHSTHLGSPISSSSIFDLWHKRLGHLCNKTVMTVLQKCNIVSKHCRLNSVCSACQLDKFRKLPFSPSTTVYTPPFELIVSDLLGLAPVVSEGHFYYISFVDAYSRYTWLYLIKCKSEALDKFLHLQKFVEVQFGCKIKVIQTDWGRKFRSFPKVLYQLGIYHRLSCPHTSEQNGLVERKHRHLVDTGLTLLAQANMPMYFWAHAFISAVYLINRLPTSVLTGRSPYEVLYQTMPSYTHLKVFGFLFTKDTNVLMPPVGSLSLSMWCLMKLAFLLPVLLAQVVILSLLTLSLAQQVLRTVLWSAISPPLESTDLRLRPNASLSPGNATFSSYSTHRSTPTPIAVIPPVPLSQNPSSSLPVKFHPMQTRSKSGIFKTKVFSTKLSETKPATVEEAFASKEWTLVAQQEWHHCCYKGHLVIKGYLQEARIDFQNTFSPVVKPTTIRVVLTLAIKFGWQLRQVDINNAFLNGDLSEEIYMVQPPSFEQNHGDRSLVCRLKKALYGLKQAPRAWFFKLRNFLLSPHFVLITSDGSLFVKKIEGVLLYVLVYVDDIIVTGNHQASIDGFVATLDTQFSLKDLGSLSYFLGIEITSTVDGLFLSQHRWICCNLGYSVFLEGFGAS